jgi:hypothetical protein
MKTFNDLEFTPRTFGGVGTHTEINGFVLSVQASESCYCSPRENYPSQEMYDTFEIAIWKSGGSRKWSTKQFVNVNDDVAAYLSRTDITEIIQKLENYTH